MAEEFESVELEYSEEDILYFLEDEEGREIGFAIEEDGQEVEYFYEGYEADDYEAADGSSAEPEAESEAVELEYSEDDILYYLVDEDDNELGFVIMEDGREVECWYEEEEAPAASRPRKAAAPEKPEAPKPKGRLAKLAAIAGHEGGKARKKAEVQIDKVRGVAETGVEAATAAVESGGEKLKQKRQSGESDLGITREGVSEFTSDLNAIAKEGAATAKELKEAYDDIMDSYGFLMPKNVRRRMP